jgi:tRNA(Ile)-lysidine synthase
MLSPGDRVGVAVSGGADSVALLEVLESIRNDLGVALLVVHFDHGLRGSESDLDAQFVAELAHARGLEFILDRADVAAEARRNKWNLEDGGRRLRYAFFQRIVEQGRATRIGVAHTADDQAETVIAHIVRGTGPTGLAGIYPVAGSIVRPLLGIRRRELRSYLSGLGQRWREDSTNEDTTRLRARIRSRLLPQFERDFSPRFVEHLCELARFSQEEQDFWSALVEERYEALVTATDKTLAISTADLIDPFRHLARFSDRSLKCETASSHPWRTLSERLIRRLYQELRGDRRELTADHIEQVLRLATRSTSGRGTPLPGGIVVKRTFDDLVFSVVSSAKVWESSVQTVARPFAYQYVVSLPLIATATVSVPELGVRFSLKLIDWAGTQRETKRDTSVLDADSLRAPLILRNWRPGDAYTPYGRRQPRKLKEMFLAARVPSEARRDWPVLESAGCVVWARGMPVAESVCASERTRVGVVIEEDRRDVLSTKENAVDEYRGAGRASNK